VFEGCFLWVFLGWVLFDVGLFEFVFFFCFFVFLLALLRCFLLYTAYLIWGTFRFNKI